MGGGTGSGDNLNVPEGTLHAQSWLESGRTVVSLTFIVAHGLLCHQLDAASSHYIMELVEE
jgi:hypothetical protein